MKIRFIRDGVFLEDGRHDTDDVIEVDDATANDMIQRQWALPVDDVTSTNEEIQSEEGEGSTVTDPITPKRGRG